MLLEYVLLYIVCLGVVVDIYNYLYNSSNKTDRHDITKYCWKWQ